MPQIKKVLIIDDMPNVFLNDLSKLGFKCDYYPDISEKKISSSIHQYEGIIIRNKIKLDKELLDKAIKLKFIGRAGSGMENINVGYADKKGIRCVNAPEGNRDAVGEHAIAMLLSLFNKLNKADTEIRQGHWLRENNRGTELNGKTVGIIGYGNMGAAFAKRLQGFDVKVIAFDLQNKKYSHNFAQQVDLNIVFQETDILSIHLPLTEATLYMIDDAFINKFYKNIYFINTARGKIVNTKDLVKNIKSGKIIGAALDVLEYENNTFENLVIKEISKNTWLNYLLKSDKVILSPHVAGITFESYNKISKVLIEKISALNLQTDR